MPVGHPPRGGPLGRTRGRLSASALTAYLRCPKQWFLSYQLGMRGPVRPSQILGTVLEDAVCDLLMMHPPKVDSFEVLEQWARQQIPALADTAMERGSGMWTEVLWKSSEDAWDDVSLSSLRERINGGLSLFLEEVRLCHEAAGGPYLEQRRAGEQPFTVPEPCLGLAPTFPLPDKVRDGQIRSWEAPSVPQWSANGNDVTWHEAWECARPWFKDPRVHQPQRLYHPEGWASGELDLVLRWDGKTRIVDIKSGNTDSAFSSSLEHQLRFYAWLWHETHGGELVHGMEGWYLESTERVTFAVPIQEDVKQLTAAYEDYHRAMQDHSGGVIAFPGSNKEACRLGAAGCSWCTVGRSDGVWTLPETFEWVGELPKIEAKQPYAPLCEVQGKVSVKGRLTGAWGPMPNHFSERVLGAVLVVGDQHITVEESEPGACPNLHELLEQEVVLIDALPGVWRDQARLYVDARTRIVSLSEMVDEDMPEVTRLGLLRTRANVRGHVLSINQRSGRRVDGKPWTMMSLMLWDGDHVAEVVAFGASMNQRLLSLRPGDGLAMTGAELGWRSGILQLRIDNRKTRVELF